MRRRRGILYASAALAWVLAACSLIVDGQVPEFKCSGLEPSACPSGLVCNAAKSICVSPGFRDPNDPGDFPPIPGEIDGTVSGPGVVGAACVFDTDCQAGLVCGSSTVLTTGIVQSGTSAVCTKSCCTSSECGDGFVCFMAGTGGNYCVSAEKAGRPTPIGAGKGPGEACGAPEDCRSGLCSEGVCNDTCCTQGDCAAGSTCRIFDQNGHVGWTCALQNDAGKPLNESCISPDECQNQNCVHVDYPAKGCVPSCCNARDCADQGFADGVCSYGSFGTQQIKWCFKPTQFTGNIDAGARCSQNSDCRTRLCDPEQNVCVAACCTDDDCSPGETCKPSPVGTPYLRCIPR